jgi:gliding motility-associated protein GldM
MAIPKEVRQRMINLMYLVLLALLALQIPREVILAFGKIDESLQQSNKALDQINSANVAALKEKGKTDGDAERFAELTVKVQEKSAELIAHIQGIRNQVIEMIGLDENGNIARPEEVIATTDLLYLGNAKTGEKGLAYALRQKVDETRAAMLALVPKDALGEDAYKALENTLPLTTTLPSGSTEWEKEYFDHMPAAGALAMLSKLENNVKSAENKIIEELKALVGIDRVEFDKFAARIVAPTSYVLQGETFTAEMFLSASSSENSNVRIIVNGANMPIDKDGVAKYSSRADAVGERQITGHIEVTNKKGDVSKFPFDPFKYTVAAPFATVTPTKMNVFYIGVDNPVVASAAGVSAGKLNVTMTNGNITGSGGNYNVRVSQQGEAIVTVAADGKSYGKFPFRVKMIPDPIASVGSLEGNGNMSAGELRVQRGVIAKLKNFDFDAKFEVLSYDMVFAARRQDLAVSKGNGPLFNQQMIGYLQQAKPGDLIYVENLRVRGPDGTVRSIPGITIKVM